MILGRWRPPARKTVLWLVYNFGIPNYTAQHRCAHFRTMCGPVTISRDTRPAAGRNARKAAEFPASGNRDRTSDNSAPREWDVTPPKASSGRRSRATIVEPTMPQLGTLPDLEASLYDDHRLRSLREPRRTR